MNIFVAFKNAVEKEYDRRVKAASNVRDYKIGGDHHAHDHTDDDQHGEEHHSEHPLEFGHDHAEAHDEQH
ncbi:MAG: hypothetical protein KAX40_00380 [Herpetosiphon sp.]|nr:hypothetical protein [Herpetosiphon sp.]